MSDYVKSTNFAIKDDLVTTDPSKIVKGTELDNEYNAIANAIATKANTNSPALTGTPTAPTAGSGTNTTQLATTAFVTAALSTVYPVGSIYINASSSTNPATLLGFGTWTAFGAGRVLVGLDSADTLFDTLEETGGSKNSTVVSHTHSVVDSGHAHITGLYNQGSITALGSALGNAAFAALGTVESTASATTGISIASTGSSGTNANVQPFIVVKMWKRTA